MKILAKDGKIIKLNGGAILPSSIGKDFNAGIYTVDTPYEEIIDLQTVYDGIIEIPPFENGFIFLNWDISKSDDLQSGNYIPEIVYVCIPSANVNVGMVSMEDVLGEYNSDLIFIDNWIEYDEDNRALVWTNAYKNTDYKDNLMWGSQSGHSTIIGF